MDEARLARALRGGDRRALDKAVAAYTPYLSSVVWRTLGAAARREDVEETVADAFLALWHSREGLDPGRPLKPYLAAIARNKAIDRLRSGGPVPLSLSDLDEAPGPGPEEELERQAFTAALWDAVEQLPDPDRALVEGYYFEDEALKDLAERLGLSAAAAKTRLCRARRTLKQLLIKEGLTYEAYG